MSEYREFPQPFVIDAADCWLADGVIVGAVGVPDGNPAKLPGGPGLVFQFTTGTKIHRPWLLSFSATPDPRGFVRLVEASVESALDAGQQAKATQMATDAERAAAGIDETGHTVRCPGCNARLFNDAARRGGCHGCFPELPADKAADVG